MDHSEMIHHVTPEGKVVMVMAGIPGWMFGLAIGLVIVISFLFVERWGLSDKDTWRKNLTTPRWAHRLLRKPWFQSAFQIPVMLIFLAAIFAGLFGSYEKNITPVLVWTVWWAGLIFAVALAGNAFCFVCPWDGVANLVSRVGFWRRPVTLDPNGTGLKVGASLSMGLPMPKWLDNVYPALILFIVLTWLELGFGVTTSPRQTAYLALFMVGAAVVFALVFERKAFCRSACLVGRVSGMYATFAPVEIRPRDARVCGVCKTRDCVTGNSKGHPCPTGLDLGHLEVNTYCTLCTECFSSCPSLAPAVQLRPFGRDMHRVKEGRMDEAWMALVLLALTAFHGLSMTPMWQDYAPGSSDIVSSLRAALNVSKLGAFSVGMTAVMVAPIAVYALTIGVSWRLVRDTGVTYRELFIHYAWSVLPVALFYHLAHNAMHLFMEGQEILPLLSDPMGWGWDLFGTAKNYYGPMLGQEAVWVMQVVLVLIGHLFGVTVSHRISRRLFADKGAATRSLIPPLVMMVLLSVGGLWLMHLDMNMRMGRM